MFVVKDLRKLPEILDDESDDKAKLYLARRAAEFRGGAISSTLLVSPYALPKLRNLRYLSLYDNMLHSIDGIGSLAAEACPLLVELDVGKNALHSMQNCYGAGGEWDANQTADLREVLERAHPRRRSGLRKLVARYEPGCLAHQLVDALLNEARQ